ncbi:hypothetical protein EHN07_02210 [Buttiauxella warmboldiae]|uniref:Uncharacterized protein n=1 Tax=Buttiauxella warmboldiae TaxID=82993 RepID=A0A3N5E5R2_9ENTR|nr:hypothetical protein [Buttiauxella warmboldiae]RPH30469.1 hypothetical protein EHN07_02210 [Buttiauxella warmboldiae]
MHTIQVDKNNMPLFDTFKTATVVGLLMQQVSSVAYHEGDKNPSNPYSYHLSSETTSQIRGLMMDESVGFIKELTATLNQAYSVLLRSNESNQETFIKKLDPVQTDLVELQLRGLEGAIKNVYTKCSGEQSELVKPALIATAQARASAAKLNHLISQMITHVDTFESNINMEGLRALAKHGTNVFESGKFH